MCLFFSSLSQMAPDYDHLTLMEKVEVFEHAVNNTAGDDLAKLLWLKSPSSEVCSSVFTLTPCNFSPPESSEKCIKTCFLEKCITYLYL